jgi:5-hydroxyisourate hydrolase
MRKAAATVSLSSHVLDAAVGRPAAGLSLALDRAKDGDWELIGGGVTDDDGRWRHADDAELAPGTYRLTFATGDYFRASGSTGFYPEVAVTFEVTDAAAHYHVPLLLSPYAYSTYRGS